MMFLYSYNQRLKGFKTATSLPNESQLWCHRDSLVYRMLFIQSTFNAGRWRGFALVLIMMTAV